MSGGEELLVVGKRIKVEDVVAVGRFYEEVEVSEETRNTLNKSRKVVEEIIERGRAVYGINTGFGALASVRVSREKLDQLQRNILLSHAAGFGDPLEEEVVRGMLFLRAVSLSKGFSGVRPVVVEKLVELLNKRVYPYVPSKGSVGASGDLAPLAHAVLPIIGEGFVIKEGEVKRAREVLRELSIDPISLEEKEGLALVNGTQAMASILSFVVRDSLRLLQLATIASAISFASLNGIKDAFDPRIHELRPHNGQRKIARWFWELLRDYPQPESSKVQDAYTLRTIPQVYGAVLDTIEYVKGVLEVEINSVTDNPLVLENGDVISGGNFHGEPLALAADFLSIALTDLGNMIERRVDRILNPKTNEGLPAFLAGGEEGLNSGYMLFQYTAAALCNENKVLSHPASSDTIPTSAYQEDHVSMGMNAALKLKRIFENLISILSIELLVGSVAFHMRFGDAKFQVADLAARFYKLVEKRNGDDLFWEDFQRVRKEVSEIIRREESLLNS